MKMGSNSQYLPGSRLGGGDLCKTSPPLLLVQTPGSWERGRELSRTPRLLELGDWVLRSLRLGPWGTSPDLGNQKGWMSGAAVA